MFLLIVFLAFTSGSPIRCIEQAPYNLRQTDTVLAIYDIAQQGQALYEYRLATLIENLNLLPPSQVEPALDQFMEIFCDPPYFKAFIGITNDGARITNRTLVRELYKGTGLASGTHIPFNVKAYNLLTSIDPDAQINFMSAYVNVTAFYEVVLRVGDPVNANFMFAHGHYQNEFRVDEDGNVCISAFQDVFLDLNLLPHTPILEIPWDLPITSL